MITVSAPGKINLMGEHAIVHGKPSLLSAINLRTQVTVVSQKSKLQSKENLEIITKESSDYIRHVVCLVKQELKIVQLPPMKITVASEIPSGYHLGSSAAVAVATVGALMYFLKKIWDPERINEIAYEAEKKMHGNPSGGDNTAVTCGGFLWFRKELEFLKLKAQLPIELSQKLNHFFLVDTGRSKESTGEMVAMVGAKVKSQPAEMEKIFSENERQTKKIARALREENEDEIIDAIKTGERTLEKMGVVSKRVMPLIRKIETIGGAAKILGGGGKKNSVGFLLCFHRDQKRVEEVCKPYYYYSIQPITLGAEGVRLEQS